MSNAEIYHLNSSGVTQKRYVIEGAVTISERMTQTTPQLTFPKQGRDRAVLNTLFGQKEEVSVSFIMMQRSDDYTSGTGTAGDGSPNTQKNYLKDNIFKATGYHVFYDEQNNSFLGRIANVDIQKAGDEPNIYVVSFQFLVGISPI